MPRYNITMPEGLWDRIGVEAPAGNRSFFIREAIETALGSRESYAAWAALGDKPETTGLEGAPAPPRASARRCENPHCTNRTPTSLKVTRCQCGGRLVEG